MRILVLSGENHGFDQSAEVIRGFLNSAADLEAQLESDKDILTSPSLQEFHVCVFGTGFTRAVQRPDGEVVRERDLTPAQEDGLFEFVAGGRGLVGVHGTAWWVDTRAVDLLGGHANWHPPGLTFTVNIADPSHPVTRGLSDFEVEDEIYMSAWDPGIHGSWPPPSGAARTIPWPGSGPTRGGACSTPLWVTRPARSSRPAMQTLMTQGVRWAGSN